MKTYKYTNFDGREKALIVRESTEPNMYYIEIWNLSTGDFCGNGKKSLSDIARFLANYGVEI